MGRQDSKPRTPQFGAILLRAAEMIGDQGSEAFDRLGIDFDARKTSIVLTLHSHGPLSSTDIAREIGHSRQMIEARLKTLIKKDFLIEYQDPDDARKRLYDFADAALPVVEEIVAVMRDFEAVYDALWDEIGVNVEQALLAMETALGRRSLIDRLTDTRDA